MPVWRWTLARRDRLRHSGWPAFVYWPAGAAYGTPGGFLRERHSPGAGLIGMLLMVLADWWAPDYFPHEIPGAFSRSAALTLCGGCGGYEYVGDIKPGSF